MILTGIHRRNLNTGSSLAKLFLNSFFLFVLLFASHSDVVLSETSLEYEGTAENYLKKGEYRSAIHYYRQSLEKNPNNTKSHIGAGQSYFVLGDYTRSEYHFNRAITLDKGNEKAMIGLGLLYIEMGQYKKAKTFLDEVAKNNPGSISNNYAKGLLYLRQNKADFAELYFNKVLKLNPGHVLSLLALSEIEMSRGRSDIAENYWNKAQKLDSLNPELHRVRARMDLQYANDDSHPDREAYLERARESLLNADIEGSSSTEQEIQIIWIDIIKGEYAKAKERVDLLLAKNSDDPKLNYLAATLSKFTKQSPDLTANYYSKILLKNPDDSIARFSFEEYVLSKEEYFSPSGEIRKKLAMYHMIMSNKFEMEGQTKRSFSHLQRGILLYPDSKVLLEKRKDKMLRTGNFEGYLRDLVLLKRKSPDNYKLLHRLEVALQNKKKYIAYRERLLSADDINGRPTFKRTPTYVYIYDIKSQDPFPSYPDSPSLFADAIIYYLSDPGKAEPVPESFRKSVKNAIYYSSKNRFNADRGIFFDTSNIAFIEEQETPDLTVSYILEGDYSIINGTITMRINLMEKNTTRSIMKFNVSASGKNAVHDVSYHIARRIAELPYRGRIIKVYKKEIFINLGSADGVKAGDKFSVPGKGVITVSEVNYYVSRANAENGNHSIFTAGEHASPVK